MSAAAGLTRPDAGVTPSGEQAAAIRRIIDWYRSGPQEFYLAGYAGVGKSTVAAVAIEELTEKCGVRNVRSAAYTGKAASVMRKKGVEGAQTIHSLIYTAIEDEETGEVSFVLSEDSPAADADLIVLDEVSMVNKELADDLRSFGKKILVMGDPGQLPPVSGEGAFTSREPDVFLREIHRQAAGSPIIELATLARQGKPLPNGYDKGGVRVLPLTKETQPLIYRPETQALCGLNRVRWVYTQRIRRLREFEGEMPQPGERLICCRNNREEGLFNGGMGALLSVGPSRIPGTVLIDVQMEDFDAPHRDLVVDPYLFRRHFTGVEAQKLKLPRGFPRLDEFDFGAVLTVHKGQGSSWDDVTVIDDSHCFREHKANHLYTAITRAERTHGAAAGVRLPLKIFIDIALRMGQPPTRDQQLKEEIMNSNKHHTPGPWRKERLSNGIRCADGRGAFVAFVQSPTNNDVERNANGDLVAAAPDLYHIAEVIEAAYLEGPADIFHTRLNELAGGSFADLLLAGLGKVRGGL